jgi:hypothetical protein
MFLGLNVYGHEKTPAAHDVQRGGGICFGLDPYLNIIPANIGESAGGDGEVVKAQNSGSMLLKSAFAATPKTTSKSQKWRTSR